jgi:transcriptional regulator with XRE-family HTH domain
MLILADSKSEPALGEGCKKIKYSRCLIVAKTEISLIQDTLKHLMKAKNLNLSGLASKLQVSLSTAKRLLNSSDPSLAQIIDTCAYLNVSFSQVVEMATNKKQAYHFCSLHQEEFLSKNLKHLAFLHHLQKGHSVEKIASDQGISKSDCYLYCQDLEHLGFLQIDSEGNVKLLVGDGMDWHPDGPLRRSVLGTLLKGLLENYLEKEKHGSESFLDFGHKKLTAESFQQLKRDLDELSRKYGALTRIETQLHPPQKLANYTYVMLFDNWTSDLWKVTAYEKQKPK